MKDSLQQIILFLKNKHFNRAIELCKSALLQSNHPQLHLFLAIAYGEIGKLENSTSIFENLKTHFPQNSDIFYNYALMLQNNDFPEKALPLYKSCIELNPAHVSAWNNMGEIYRNDNEHQQAINAFYQCVSLQPSNFQYIRNLAISYYQYKKFNEALPLLITLIQSGQFEPEDGHALLDILITFRQLRRATEVGNTINRAHPNNPETLNLLGLNELEKRSFEPATSYLKRSLSINPDNLSALCHLSSVYMYAGQSQKYNELLDKIINFDSETAYVFAGMLLETSGQKQKAATVVNQGLKKFPNNAELMVILAKIFKQEKEYSQCLNSINNALKMTTDAGLEASAFYVKGQVLDKTKEYEPAWEAFKKANNSCLNSWQLINKEPDQFIEICGNIVDSFRRTSYSSISAGSTSLAGSELLGNNLIFIVGFPRSGTTLLDSILSAHSDITVLEEAPVVGATYDKINDISAKNYAEKIIQLTAEDKHRLREYYYQSLPNYTDWNQSGVLVDKSPLNTMHVGLIHQLFPQAKILFAQRHPLDVCLSCYFQDFKMNSFMTNMTDINRTAQTYDAMLKVWTTSIEALNIEVHYQSYEELVSDFENQVKKLFKHLDLTWQEQVLTFQETLKNRGVISTPSYDQVNQPIYQSSKNRYNNYSTHLTEARKTLQPWLSKFNYEALF